MSAKFRSPQGHAPAEDVAPADYLPESTTPQPKKPGMLLGECVLTLPQAAHRLPNRPSPTTLWRWCRKGLKGTRLEYLRRGRTIITSMEAMERFFSALARADEDVTSRADPHSPCGHCVASRPVRQSLRSPRVADPAARARAIEHARQALDQAVI